MANKLSAKGKREAYDRQNEYRRGFKANNYKGFTISLRKEEDKEIIDYFSSIEKKTDYLRELILRDMKEKGIV